MFYAIFVPQNSELPEDVSQRPALEELVFDSIKEANAALKRFKGSRMKTFSTHEKALNFLMGPDKDESFIDLDSSFSSDLVTSLERLSLQQSPRNSTSAFLQPQSPIRPDPTSASAPSTPNTTIATSTLQAPFTVSAKPTTTSTSTTAADEAETVYPSAKPAMLNQLRRKIEAGDYEAVEQTIWSNPRCLISVCDSAIYLMAGPKYNACHIAARANKPDIMALLLDTITNFSFLRKLYPKEEDANIQDRVNHLLDSYLNTPEPRQGNTPLHFACKLGHYRVVRVLLTFEGCDLNLRDSNGLTAEEATCAQYVAPKVIEMPPERTPNDDDTPCRNGVEYDEHNDGTTTTTTSKKQAVGDSNGGLTSESSETTVKNKIRNLFKRQLHLPLFRDQLKKRLVLERRRSRASSQMDSDTSFSDIDESFIFNSPIKSKPSTYNM